jgi:hypothetical protein
MIILDHNVVERGRHVVNYDFYVVVKITLHSAVKRNCCGSCSDTEQSIVIGRHLTWKRTAGGRVVNISSLFGYPTG